MKETTTFIDVPAMTESEGPSGDVGAANKLLARDVSQGFDLEGKSRRVLDSLTHPKWDELNPKSIETYPDIASTALATIVGGGLGGLAGAGMSGGKKMRKLKTAIGLLLGAGTGYVASRVPAVLGAGDHRTDVHKDMADHDKTSSFSAMLEASSMPATGNEDAFHEIRKAKKKRKPSPFAALASIAAGAGLYGGSKAYMSDDDVSKLEALRDFGNKWDPNSAVGPKFTTDYNNVASGASNVNVFGVPVHKLIPALKHRMEPGTENYELMKSHYTAYSRGPLSAFLHDFGDYRGAQGDRRDFTTPAEESQIQQGQPIDKQVGEFTVRAPSYPHFYDAFKKWFDTRAASDPIIAEAGLKSGDEAMKLLQSGKMTTGLQSHLQSAFISDALGGQMKRDDGEFYVDPQRFKEQLSQTGMTHMQDYKDFYEQPVKAAINAHNVPKYLGMGLGVVGTGLLAKYLWDIKKRRDHKNRLDELRARRGEKTASAIGELKAIKRAGDYRQYGRKNRLTRNLVQMYPQDFKIDSVSGQLVGLTHVPTGFRVHAPVSIVNDILEVPEQEAAVVTDKEAQFMPPPNYNRDMTPRTATAATVRPAPVIDPYWSQRRDMQSWQARRDIENQNTESRGRIDRMAADPMMRAIVSAGSPMAFSRPAWGLMPLEMAQAQAHGVTGIADFARLMAPVRDSAEDVVYLQNLQRQISAARDPNEIVPLLMQTVIDGRLSKLKDKYDFVDKSLEEIIFNAIDKNNPGVSYGAAKKAARSMKDFVFSPAAVSLAKLHTGSGEDMDAKILSVDRGYKDMLRDNMYAVSSSMRTRNALSGPYKPAVDLDAMTKAISTYRGQMSDAHMAHAMKPVYEATYTAFQPELAAVAKNYGFNLGNLPAKSGPVAPRQNANAQPSAGQQVSNNAPSAVSEWDDVGSASPPVQEGSVTDDPRIQIPGLSQANNVNGTLAGEPVPIQPSMPAQKTDAHVPQSVKVAMLLIGHGG